MKGKIYLVAGTVLFLASCRTAKTTTDSHKVNNEITADADKDSSGKKTEQAVNVKSEDNTTEYQIVFDVDTTEKNVKAEDYLPFVKIDSNGTITAKGKIKSVTSKTHNKTTDSLHVAKTDSSSVKERQRLVIKNTDETVHKQTTRKGIFAVVFWPVLILVLGFLLIVYFKRKAEKKAADAILK